MKLAFYRCVTKVCGVLITLLGFTAPITLASCYGPMPDRYYAAEEVADSLSEDADSLQVSASDDAAEEDASDGNIE